MSFEGERGAREADDTGRARELAPDEPDRVERERDLRGIEGPERGDVGGRPDRVVDDRARHLYSLPRIRLAGTPDIVLRRHHRTPLHRANMLQRNVTLAREEPPVSADVQNFHLISII